MNLVKWYRLHMVIIRASVVEKAHIYAWCRLKMQRISIADTIGKDVNTSSKDIINFKGF